MHIVQLPFFILPWEDTAFLPTRECISKDHLGSREQPAQDIKPSCTLILDFSVSKLSGLKHFVIAAQNGLK